MKKNQFNDFIYSKKNRLKVLEYASKKSIEDLKFTGREFIKSPSVHNYMKFSKIMFNSSTWIGKSTFRLLNPYEPSLNEKLKYLETAHARYILKKVRDKELISHQKATYSEIFKTIFYDFELSRLDSKRKKISNVPQIESSVLLVSGVFNEIFSTPAFKRGAEYIQEKYNIDFNYCPTSGIKDTAQNSAMIRSHIEKLLKGNKKVWFFAFSKGGIDTLHFLKDYGQDYKDRIIGLSTIASPLLGSERVNHKIIRFINSIHSMNSNKLYLYLDKKFDFLFKKFQESLSSEFQEEWFQEHYSYLPRNMFYTALAFQSQWYESHVWMILTKLFFQSQSINDGIVDAERALYPDYFQGINLGILKGHHLIGTRSSDYGQEALIEAHITFLNYLNLLH